MFIPFKSKRANQCKPDTVNRHGAGIKFVFKQIITMSECFTRHFDKRATEGGFLNFSFYALYSTLLHLPPVRFRCVGRFWDRTQDCCDFGINLQDNKKRTNERRTKTFILKAVLSNMTRDDFQNGTSQLTIEMYMWRSCRSRKLI